MAVMRPPEKSVHIEDKRYVKIAELATGGMATVYFGRVRGAGGFEQRVAIKEMLPHLAKSAEFVRMFVDEARLASGIHHPNVVATLDMTESNGSHALILEYVEGPSLQQIMKYLAERGGTMPLDIALRIFLDILAGLHAAHELADENGRRLNLVHRDVSPQNMLVGTDGITKITDFGIARAESRLSTTRTGSVKGKVPYMSPEQIKSLPVDRRTDVYAAGVILWEMLTSQRLVQGETEVAMIYQVTDREATNPRDWNPAIPESIANVCLKALEKQAENRFVSAVELMETLEQAASASTVTPATARAVGNYIRGLALHHTGADLEADFRRKSQLDLNGYSSESSSSKSILNLISAPRRALDGQKRPMVLMGIAASAVTVLGMFLWLGFSGTKSSSPNPATNPPLPVIPETTTVTPVNVATPPASINPAPVATNPPANNVIAEPPLSPPLASTSASAKPKIASAASTTAKSTPLVTTKKTVKRVYSPQGL